MVAAGVCFTTTTAIGHIRVDRRSAFPSPYPRLRCINPGGAQIVFKLRDADDDAAGGIAYKDGEPPSAPQLQSGSRCWLSSGEWLNFVVADQYRCLHRITQSSAVEYLTKNFANPPSGCRDLHRPVSGWRWWKVISAAGCADLETDR